MSDDFSKLRATVVSAVSGERSEAAQIALSRFAALIDQLSPADFDKVRTQLDSVLPALTAAPPNIAFAERAIANIGNTLLRSGGWVSRMFYTITNGSPIVTVYCALSWSLIGFVTLIGFYMIIKSTSLPPGTLWFITPEFLTTVSFGFLGAMVSIAFRLDTTEIERVGLVPLFLTNLAKPFIGAIFGVVVYCILQTRIITIAGINATPIETLAKIQATTSSDQVWTSQGYLLTVQDYLFWFISALAGFLSGFSERFATDLIEKSSQSFLGGTQGRPGARTDNP